MSLTLAKLHVSDKCPLYMFVDEARLFVKAFSSAMKINPLAVYQTALPFTPRHSILYKHFHDGESFPLVIGAFKSLWPPRSLKLFLGHSGAVNSVAFSPNGSQMVSGSDDMTIRIWEVDSNKQTCAPLLGHEGSVQSIAFSSDNKRIASGSTDGTIRVWDASSRQVIDVLRGHSGTVESVAFSPDGRKIVSGSSDTTVQIWDLESKRSVQTLSGHEDTVQSVAYFPNATHVVLGSEDKTIKIWEIDSKDHFTIGAHDEGVFSVSVSSDGERMASVSQSHFVVWDLVQRKIFRKMYCQDLTSIAISPDGTQVLTGSCENIAQLRNLSSLEKLALPFQLHSDMIASVAFDISGTLIACGSVDKLISLWDMKVVLGPNTEMASLEHIVSSIALSTDAKRLVTGRKCGKMQVWDTHSFKEIITLQSPSSSVIAVCICCVALQIM